MTLSDKRHHSLFWEALFDAAVEAIIVADANGRIEAFNQSAERMFGYVSEEVVGKNLKMLMPKPHSDNHDQYIETYRDTGKAKIIGIGREVFALRKDGSEVPVNLSIGEFKSPEGAEGFVGVLYDISDRRDAERRVGEHQEKLAAIARMNVVGELAQGIVHEISQPLSALTNYAQALENLERNAAADPAMRRELLHKVLLQADRAAQILTRLRSFIKHRAPSTERINIAPLLDRAVKLVGSEVRRTGTPVIVELVEDNLFVSADPVQIEQILLNLILNALHSIASAGHHEPVLLSARKCGDRVVIEVLDRGIGVDPKIEKDLFSYFVSTKEGGLGIGLNLSATLALSFGGKIEHRRPKNGGARFLLDLPYAEES